MPSRPVRRRSAEPPRRTAPSPIHTIPLAIACNVADHLPYDGTGMKVCTVYFRGSEVYILASAKTVSGIFYNSEPFFKLTQPVSAQELGEKILQALDSCREGIPDKKYVRGVKQAPDSFLLFSGFRSWSSFEKGAKHFMISSQDSEATITPSVPASQGGYSHQPDYAVQCILFSQPIGDHLLALAAEP